MSSLPEKRTIPLLDNPRHALAPEFTGGKTLVDLQSALMDNIDKLSDGKLDPGRANAISSLAGRLLDSLRVQMEVVSFGRRK